MRYKKMICKIVAFGLAVVLGMTTFGADIPIAKSEAASTVAIEKKNFPDANFRKSLKKYYDKNKDGRLSTAELKKIKKLSLFSYDSEYAEKNYFFGVKNVKGVEKLKYLNDLCVFGSNITKLDCSKLSALKKLNVVACNKLTSINVKNLKNLTSLSVDSCKKIKELDVTSNPNLKDVVCTYSKNFRTLKSGEKNKKLSGVYVYGESVSKLDISKLGALKKLNISDTNIDLDETGLVNKAQITTLGISGVKKNANTKFSEYPSLIELQANRLGLTTVDLSANSKLENLELESNNLSSVDVSNMKNLKWISLAGNKKLKTLDVSSALKISYISAEKNMKITLPNREYFYTMYYDEETGEYYDKEKVIKISNPYVANNGSVSLNIKNSKDELYISVMNDDSYNY